jgi:hypothetical protein
MFTRSDGVIRSDEGFSVQLLGRSGVLYKEGDHEMVIGSEGVIGGIAVWRATIQTWKPPHHVEPIDDRKRESILENICQALRFQGDEIKVIGW